MKSNIVTRLLSIMPASVCIAGAQEATGHTRSVSDPTSSAFFARPGDPVIVSGTLISIPEGGGGCWTLQMDSGGRMQLAGLPAEFQQNGLHVSATVHVEANRVGDCWPGLLLFVDNIRIQAELNDSD